MFAKINRLKKTADFKRIFRHSRVLGGDLMDLRLISNELDVCRFGFIVSLKVSKKATVRNKIKRQLSEIAKILVFPVKKPMDILIIAKPNIIGKTRQEILINAENIFKKAKIYP